MLCTDTVLYLLIIVCIQTRDDTVFIAKVRNSTPLRRLLEIATILATIFLPLAILWVPFITGHYGYTGSACGLKDQGNLNDLNFTNQSTSNSSKDIAMTFVYKYAVVGSTIAVSIVSNLAIAIVYCTLPTKYQHAKHSVRNMVMLFASIVIYLLVYSLVQLLLNLDQRKEMKIFSLCLENAGKFVLLIGYIVVFHFTKFCQPIRKLFSFKKPEPHQQQEAAPLQEQEEEVKNYESVEKKQSSVTPVTHFTIRHTGAFTSAPPTAE